MTKETQVKTRSPRRMAREPGTQSPAEKTPASESDTSEVEDTKAGVAASPKTPSKIEAVLTLLRRAEGATLEELTKATGWQKHTVRASLTGLKKKGHVIQRGKRGETTCYNVEAGA